MLSIFGHPSQKTGKIHLWMERKLERVGKAVTAAGVNVFVPKSRDYHEYDCPQWQQPNYILHFKWRLKHLKLNIFKKEYIKTLINLALRVLDFLKNVDERQSQESIPVELPFFINSLKQFAWSQKNNCIEGKSSLWNPPQTLVKNCLGRLRIFESGFLYEWCSR